MPVAMETAAWKSLLKVSDVAAVSRVPRRPSDSLSSSRSHPACAVTVVTLSKWRTQPDVHTLSPAEDEEG